MTCNPTIAVIMATYNGQKYISKQTVLKYWALCLAQEFCSQEVNYFLAYIRDMNQVIKNIVIYY